MFLEKKLSNINCERLRKALIYIKSYFIYSNDNMYLTVDSLIDINNIETGSINITLRKVNAKPYGYDKIFVDKVLIEDKLYQLIDQFNERKISHIYHKIYFHFMMEIKVLKAFLSTFL